MVTVIDDKALEEAGRAIDRKIATERDRQVYLNFFDAFLSLDLNKYRASEFPNGLFDQVVDRINEEPAMLLAIRAWDTEGNLVESQPAADGLLGTAATGALTMAEALSRVLTERETRNDHDDTGARPSSGVA